MTGPSVMIVDDDDDLRELIAMIVDSGGYEAVQAFDGIDALEQIERGPRPAVILLDLRMPRMNGTELLSALRSMEKTSSIPVIALSGDIAAHAEAIYAGAVAALKKPIESRALLDALHKFAR